MKVKIKKKGSFSKEPHAISNLEKITAFQISKTLNAFSVRQRCGRNHR